MNRRAFLGSCAGVLSAQPGTPKLERFTVAAPTGGAMEFSTAGKVTAVIFISAVCPISNDYNDRMSVIYRDYSVKGVQLVFVNANGNETPAEVLEHAKAAEFPFPVFTDPKNALSERLAASVTPETFVFDREGSLRYRGAIDDARNVARVHVNGLRDALDALLAGKPVPRAETKAFGCTIKKARKAS